MRLRSRAILEAYTSHHRQVGTFISVPALSPRRQTGLRMSSWMTGSTVVDND